MLTCKYEAAEHLSVTHLAPYEVRIWILVKVWGKLGKRYWGRHNPEMQCITHQVIREGRNLLQTTDCDIIDATVLTFLKESMIHLACNGMSTRVRSDEGDRRRTRAENVASNLFRSNQSIWVGVRKIPLELGISSHLRQVGTGLGMTEERLGEEANELITVCQRIHFEE